MEKTFCVANIPLLVIISEMVGTRRQGRTIALQALYEVDTARHGAEDALFYLLEEEVPPESAAFARELVEGVLCHREEADSLIAHFAPAYPVEMLSAVDRTILRLAIYEMLFSPEVPVKVVINEAVELAKIFGSESSSRFINGVLGAVSRLAQEKRLETEGKEVILWPPSTNA